MQEGLGFGDYRISRDESLHLLNVSVYEVGRGSLDLGFACKNFVCVVAEAGPGQVVLCPGPLCITMSMEVLQTQTTKLSP